jgi:phosphatidylinositol kinase/protein kinase (PI-3  family)
MSLCFCYPLSHCPIVPRTQALIYPLTVASKSQAPARKEAALKILDKMRAHSMIVVEQV